MASYFYKCKCGCKFKHHVKDKNSGGIPTPPSDEQIKKNKTRECPECGTIVDSYWVLPKKSVGVFRIQVDSGPYKGQFLSRTT